MRTTRLRFSVALLCAVIVAAASGGQRPLRAAPADFTRYHTYDELAAALKAAVTAHPVLAKLVSIGKTREGRDIWAVEVAKPSGPPVDSRPGQRPSVEVTTLKKLLELYLRKELTKADEGRDRFQSNW